MRKLELYALCCSITFVSIMFLFMWKMVMFFPFLSQFKEKRAELDIIKLTFVRRVCEFLRDYFVKLVDSMMSDKRNFSQVCFSGGFFF